MTSDSKIFVSLRSTRSKPSLVREKNGPRRQWDGCDRDGSHRAPVGADAEGLYLLFCEGHVREYIKGYNFAPKLSDPLIARYQREAATGRRRTWGTLLQEVTEIPLPSMTRSGTAKTLNARKNAARSQAGRAASQLRKLKVLEARAFETLGLPWEATSAEIRTRYKQRLKMHHPDVNSGDRASEESLQATIEAYKILKLNGFC